MALLPLDAVCVRGNWQDLGRVLTGSVLDVYGRIMGPYEALKHRAPQMLRVVAKGTEEGHYRFSQDNKPGLVQPGFQENPRQGRFDQNTGRK